MKALVVAPRVLSPGESAERMNTSPKKLAALIRRYQYEFTELVPGGKPGDRGRNRWGLTEAQLATIIQKQARGYEPVPEPAATTAPASTSESPDGVSRLHIGRRTRS